MAARGAPVRDTLDFLAGGGGEVSALMRAHDWSASPLGDPETWPQSLRSMVGLMLGSRFPMFVAWGDELGFLYNDPYAEILGAKHPQALGRRFYDIWSEIWLDISPLVDAAMAGEATYRENLPLLMDRKGYGEQTWFTFSYSPVRDESGRVAGMFCACTETTALVLSGMRRDALLKLDERLRDVADTADLSFAASEVLGEVLSAARVGYGAVDPDAGTIVIERNWYAPGFDDLAGVHRFADYGSYIDDLRRGEAVANADVEADPRTAGNVDAFKALGIRAHLDVPVLESGQLVGQIFVHAATPRVWTDEEVAFVRNFAERTRAAIARRLAEQELRESEARFRALATVGSSVLYRMSPDWREMRRLDGAGFLVDTVEPTTDWVDTYIPLDERSRVREAIDRAAGAKDVFELEHRVLRADGTVGWAFSRAIPLLDGAGEIAEWFGESSDVTARVKADQSFTRLFQASPAPFLVVKPDAPRFTIAEVNDAYLAATMRTREGLVGRGIFEAFPDNPDDATVAGVSTLRASLERALAFRRRDALPGFKYDIARPDGTFEERWWSPVNSPVLDERGEVEAIIHNANDITESLRADAALRESEARFRKMLEIGTVSVVFFDMVGGITGANDAFLELIGYSRAELEAGEVRYENLTLPDWAWRDEQTIAELLATGQSVPFEKEYMRKDGTRIWIYCSGKMLDARTAVEFIVDVTERKRTEAALAESEERLRLAVDNAEVGFWDVDVVNGQLIWPARTKAMFGISAGIPVTMQDFYDGLHLADRETTSEAYAAAANPAVRALYDVEYRAVGKEDGIVRWVAAKGRGVFDGPGADARCLRVAGTAIEITPRKLAEERLRELNETLERRVTDAIAERDRTWNNARDLLLVIGTDGVFRATNPAWTGILGWKQDELVGRSYLDFIHPDDHPSSRGALGEASREGLPNYENRYVHKDGSFRWISWVAAPEGKLIYASGRDVTIEKERQAELDAAQGALRQSQKMEAMGQLTGGVAHDFNNLLTPIIGSLDMLQRKGLGGEREQRLIAGAAQSAERAKTLIQRLLAFARRQPLQAVPVDIVKLVTGMGDLVASTTGPQIKVVVEAADDLPPAKADPNQLEMALLNLSVNARDAMPDGGTLRISATSDGVGSGHRSELKPGAYIRLSVADTGSGMDEATLARAVEPFFSTKGIGKGTGLGLSMVHGLASQLGGALTIQSRPGLGTNIELWLPQSAAAPDVSDAVPDAAPEIASCGRALLVDDEELVRMSTADMLADLGYAVVEAASGEQAMRLIDKGERFDLLVTDHLMPGMTGTDLARAVRSARADLPVLLVSGYAESEGIAPDLPRLTKPFRKDELAAALAQLSTPV